MQPLRHTEIQPPLSVNPESIRKAKRDELKTALVHALFERVSGDLNRGRTTAPDEVKGIINAEFLSSEQVELKVSDVQEVMSKVFGLLLGFMEQKSKPNDIKAVFRNIFSQVEMFDAVATWLENVRSPLSLQQQMILTEQLEFDSPEKLLRLAQHLALNNPTLVAANLEFFEIKEEEDRFNLGLQLVSDEMAQEATPSLFDALAIRQKEHLEALLLRWARTRGSSLAWCMSRFEIREEMRNQIALAAAKTFGCPISEHLDQFHLIDGPVLGKIAASQSDINPEEFCRWAHKYHLPSAALEQFARTMACDSRAPFLMKSFANFDTGSPDLLRDVAFNLAKHRPNDFVNSNALFRNLPESDKEELFEILCIGSIPAALAYSVENDVGDPEEIDHQLIRYAAFHPTGALEWIKHHPVASEMTRLELFQYVVNKNNAVQIFSEFQFKTTECLEEAFAFLLDRFPRVIGPCFSTMHSKDPILKDCIASLFFEKNPKQFCSQFSHFRFSPSERIVWAEKVLLHSPTLFGTYFGEFDIEKLPLRQKFAERLFSQNPITLCNYFSQFKLTDSDTKTFAHRFARDCPNTLLLMMDSFRMDLASKQELVRILAEGAPDQLCGCLNEFRPMSPELALDIAKIVAAKNGCYLHPFISEFNISNPRDLREVARIAFQRNFLENVDHLNDYGFNHHPLFKSLATREECEQAFFRTFARLQLPRESTLFRKSIEAALRLEGEDLCAACRAILQLFLYAELYEIPPDRLEKMEPVFIEVLDTRDLNLMYYISDSALHLLHRPDIHECLIKTAQQTSSIFLLLLFEFDPSASAQDISLWGRIFSDKVFKNRAVARVFIYDLFLFIKSNGLKADQKKALLKHFVLNQNSTARIAHQNLEFITTLVAFHKEDDLLHYTTPEELEKAILRLVRSAFPISSIPDVNFSPLWEKTFGLFHQPLAILKYAAVLRDNATEPELLKVLNAFTESVLLGTFPSIRYITRENAHLFKIESEFPDLFRAWQRPFRFTPELTMPGEVEIKKWTVQFFDRLGHLPLFQENRFSEFLHGKISWTEWVQIVDEKMKGLTKVKPNPDIYHRLKLCHLQRELGTLMSGESPSSQLPKKWPAFLGSLARYPEYKKLSEALQTNLAPYLQDAKQEGLIIVMDDNPCDLLLSGTEVAGSCQHVQDPYNSNYGLLATLMDGKIRELALKNKQDHTVARCFLKLLWDTGRSRPCILMEPIYPLGAAKAHISLLLDAAKKVAAGLGVDLKGNEHQGSTNRYDDELVSYDTPAPYEYSDTSGGLLPRPPPEQRLSGKPHYIATDLYLLHTQ